MAAKLSTGAKVFLGVVVGTGVLWAGSAFAAGGDDELPPADPGANNNRDASDAQQATAVFAAAIAAAGGIVSATCVPCIPYVGASTVVVGTAWQNLSTQDKARVWRGEMK